MATIEGPVEHTTAAGARREVEAEEVAAALRHAVLHGLRVRRARHARPRRLERRRGLHLARPAGRPLRRALRARARRDRKLVHRGRRPLRVGEARLGRFPPASWRSSTGSRTRSGWAARSRSSPARRGRRRRCRDSINISARSATTPSSSSSSGSRLASRSSRCRRQVDPDGWRFRADLRDGLLHPHGRHLRDRARRRGLPRRRPLADDGGLHRPRPGTALQLRRLRAPKRRRRGDDQPAAGRSDLDRTERRHRRAPLRDPHARDPARPAGREGDGDRRLRRRDQRDVQRLRRRPELPLRRHRARVHPHPGHVGRGLDDRLRPDPGGRRVRRGVLPPSSASSTSSSGRRCASTSSRESRRRSSCSWA